MQSFPCVLCGQPEAMSGLCARCIDVLPWNQHFCECCGQPLVVAQSKGVSCGSCQLKKPVFSKARAPLVYEFPVDDVLKAIKFRRQLWYLPPFAALLVELLKREFADIDSLVPVPLHRFRQMRRGFNQAFEICRELKKVTQLPINTQAVRTRATRAQTGLNASERRKNLKGAFAIRGTLRGRYPLIVDDVITTGETCSQLARELKKSGAERVGVLAVARAYVPATGLNV